MIYLDYNATTPCLDEVVEGMLPYFSEKFGNPSSTTYPLAWQSDEAVKLAREKVANLLQVEPNEIVFTSGATEACNLAIKGMYDLYKQSFPDKSFHIITCATEHSAVLDTCNYLENFGAEVTYLGVDASGKIDINELINAIKSNTILIAVMYANNETGVLQDMEKIAAIAQENKITLFSDCTQALGKIAINLKHYHIGMAAISAHKIYGPKGVGALFVSRKQPRVRLIAQQNGGGHEQGRRSGTLNVPGIVGFGIAAEWQNNHWQKNSANIKALRDDMEALLLEIENATINGDQKNRLPNVINIAFADIKAEKLISIINHDLCISVGSACNASENKPSHVLTAMGLDKEALDGSIRISLGKDTTKEDIDTAVTILKSAIEKLK